MLCPVENATEGNAVALYAPAKQKQVPRHQVHKNSVGSQRGKPAPAGTGAGRANLCRSHTSAVIFAVVSPCCYAVE